MNIPNYDLRQPDFNALGQFAQRAAHRLRLARAVLSSEKWRAYPLIQARMDKELNAYFETIATLRGQASAKIDALEREWESKKYKSETQKASRIERIFKGVTPVMKEVFEQELTRTTPKQWLDRWENLPSWQKELVRLREWPEAREPGRVLTDGVVFDLRRMGDAALREEGVLSDSELAQGDGRFEELRRQTADLDVVARDLDIQRRFRIREHTYNFGADEISAFESSLV